MADPITGDVFSMQVQISSGPAVFAEIAEVTSYDRTTTRSASRTRVFGRATPRVGTGARESGYSISALLSPEDPGQAALIAAENAGTPINVRVFVNGGIINGFLQSVEVTSKRHGARADGDWQEITFDLTAAADATVVGAGIII